jgi:hypothetical protein
MRSFFRMKSIERKHSRKYDDDDEDYTGGFSLVLDQTKESLLGLSARNRDEKASATKSIRHIA